MSAMVKGQAKFLGKQGSGMSFKKKKDKFLDEEEDEFQEEVNDKIWQQFVEMQEEAGQWFSKLREMPAYGGNVAWDHFYHQAFQSFSNLWKFQLENRPILVQYGMQRWEIGDIASRIGQLYFNFYLRSGDYRFLLESHVFYSAILQRQYYLETPLDAPFYCKKLRYHARFIIVALLLDRHQQAEQLLQELQALSQSYSLQFPGNLDIEDWELYILDIANFFKAGQMRTCFNQPSNRLSLKWGQSASLEWQTMISEITIVGFYPNMVKMGDIFSVDTYRMWTSFEWSYQDKKGLTNGHVKCDDHNPIEETLPPPQKYIISKPNVSKILASFGAALETQAVDGGLIVSYFAIDSVEQGLKTVNEGLEGDTLGQEQEQGGDTIPADACLLGLPRSQGGYLLPKPSMDQVLVADDLLPFTRRPIVLIVDSDMSDQFIALSQRLRGRGPFICLGSPLEQPPNVPPAHEIGKIFTLFLTMPQVAMCHILNMENLSSEVANEVYCQMEEIFTKWAVSLQDYLVDDSSSDEDRIWSPIAMDPFLCKIMLGFVLYNGIMLHDPEFSENFGYRPLCHPPLPKVLRAECTIVKLGVLQLFKAFSKEQYVDYV